MTLNEEIGALERLLARRGVHHVRLLRDVHYRLVLLRNVIAYLERTGAVSAKEMVAAAGAQTAKEE